MQDLILKIRLIIKYSSHSSPRPVQARDYVRRYGQFGSATKADPDGVIVRSNSGSAVP